jgi:hypothetical protein
LFDKSTAVHLVLCTSIYIKLILTALRNREAKLDRMYVHFLEQAGFIQTRRGRIVVLDRKGLEDVACECYAIVRDQMNIALS